MDTSLEIILCVQCLTRYVLSKSGDHQTAEELRSFIGLVSYLDRFIPYFSTKLDLLQKVVSSTPFEWIVRTKQAFIYVKSFLSEDSYLSLSYPELSSIVMADAILVGLGAVLLQKKINQVQIISYVNWFLSSIEWRYS